MSEQNKEVKIEIQEHTPLTKTEQPNLESQIEKVEDNLNQKVDKLEGEIKENEQSQSTLEAKINETSSKVSETKEIKEILQMQVLNINALKENLKEIKEDTIQTNHEMRLSLELVQDMINQQAEATEKLLEAVATLTLIVRVLKPKEE